MLFSPFLTKTHSHFRIMSTVRPQLTGPLGGKGLGLVYREARASKSNRDTLTYTETRYLGEEERPRVDWDGVLGPVKSGFYCTTTEYIL